MTTARKVYPRTCGGTKSVRSGMPPIAGLSLTCPKCLGHFVTHRIGADKRLLEPAKRSAAGCNNVASGAGG